MSGLKFIVKVYAMQPMANDAICHGSMAGKTWRKIFTGLRTSRDRRTMM